MSRPAAAGLSPIITAIVSQLTFGTPARDASFFRMCRWYEYALVMTGMTAYAVAAFAPQYFPFWLPVIGPLTQYFVFNHQVRAVACCCVQ